MGQIGITLVQTDSGFNNERTARAAAANAIVGACLAAAQQGDGTAYFDLGVAFSTGSHDVDCDLIEAHKWFNLAAVSGHEEAAQCRADVAEDMTAREIAEAQRRAREWLRAAGRRAA
ncbi:hypothetical protein OLX02_09945 [Novosphingobium sp. KCTC 2891]|uniref:hypothetical protein n=1 Tax=Novosphingobium sp. KCTC 2891 TaxID=2989730 RepID=UPI002222E087|nr:hypothetical protein [Novosphingobium sp. KCTC 2891]MCW1383144.1 hypothetical protein [Novosphingobium sp. KCTC 2891]